MNKERIEEIRERAEAATPGPWKVAQSGSMGDQKACTVDVPREPSPAGTPHILDMVHGYLPPDADFIAHAREDVPFLLAQLATLQARVSRAKEYATSLGDSWEEMEGGRDGIRTWEECTHCGASRNDTRNQSHEDGTHRSWCPSVELPAILDGDAQ